MKDLLISTLLLFLLLTGWLVFLTYACQQTDGFIAAIQEDLLPLIEAERWEECRQAADSLSSAWDRFRRLSLYFLDSGMLNEIDGALAKSIKYIQAEDISNSTGELNAIARQLKVLVDNQKITLQNVF